MDGHDHPCLPQPVTLCMVFVVAGWHGRDMDMDNAGLCVLRVTVLSILLKYAPRPYFPIKLIQSHCLYPFCETGRLCLCLFVVSFCARFLCLLTILLSQFILFHSIPGQAKHLVAMHVLGPVVAWRLERACKAWRWDPKTWLGNGQHRLPHHHCLPGALHRPYGSIAWWQLPSCPCFCLTSMPA